ncbi:MAG: nitroreductase [Pseudomonadota bacterium]
MSGSKHLQHSKNSTSVTDAICSRRSVRAFLPQTVPRLSLDHILRTASRAPSGTNMQPWQVLVVQGAVRARLIKAVSLAYDNPDIMPASARKYYPSKWFEPYRSRRRKIGWDLYGLLGIEKGDRERMHAQHKRNFQFFDAPVGLIFTVHQELETGSWLDYGMFLQNIMLLAREHGLHTCPQAAWADYDAIIRTVLPLNDQHVVVCGMAMGYVDHSAIENTLETEREDMGTWTRFFDESEAPEKQAAETLSR